MLAIVPQEVITLLNEQSRAASVPSMLPDVPPPARCPKCGGELAFENLYCGGRGYKPYLLCQEGDCEYMARAN